LIIDYLVRAGQACRTGRKCLQIFNHKSSIINFEESGGCFWSKEFEFICRNLVVGQRQRHIILQPNFTYELKMALLVVDNFWAYFETGLNKWQSEKAVKAG